MDPLDNIQTRDPLGFSDLWDSIRVIPESDGPFLFRHHPKPYGQKWSATVPLFDPLAGSAKTEAILFQIASQCKGTTQLIVKGHSQRGGGDGAEGKP